MRVKSVLMIALLAGTPAFAQNTNEIEPNDTKATATPVNAPMLPGHTLTGNSISTTGVGVDYWNVRIAADTPAIYRHRLVLTTTGAVGHAATIRGLGQTGAAQAPWLPGQVVGAANTTESSLQSSSTATTPARFNQWYGFGAGEQFYYRVTGAAATTADYVATLERQVVTPVDIGTYNEGSIIISTFGQGHSTDTDLWVYDSNFNPIRGYGNDDEATAAISGVPGTTGTSLQSALNRNYAAGTYYLALSNFALTNDQASPSDDDFRTGAMAEFPGLVLNSSTTTNLNMQFSITDGATSLTVPNTKLGAYDINWFRFTVVPAPSSLALLGLGGMIAARRRRA